jgi:4,5-dihydroxyphthalate decarboxylase
VSQAPTLKTVLAQYPHTQALRSGALTDPRVHLDFQDVSPVHKAFAPMVRDQAYDLCELAIVTALQAIAFGRPVVLLPAVVASRFQRGCLIGARTHGLPDPQDLAGKRVGVRAYTQTTGMWVRAHLAEDFGLDLRQVQWVTHDPAHVAEYDNPPYVLTPEGDKKTLDMLRDGEVAAAILGNDLPKGDQAYAPLIADAAARDLAWWKQHQFMPINHMVVAGQRACSQQAGAVRAAYALLRHADAQAHGDVEGPRQTLFGFERLRGPVQFTIDACVAQDLLPRRLDIDEVFAPARALLGEAGD